MQRRLRHLMVGKPYTNWPVGDFVPGAPDRPAQQERIGRHACPESAGPAITGRTRTGYITESRKRLQPLIDEPFRPGGRSTRGATDDGLKLAVIRQLTRDKNRSDNAWRARDSTEAGNVQRHLLRFGLAAQRVAMVNRPR